MANNLPLEQGSEYNMLNIVLSDPTLLPTGTFPPGTFVLYKNPPSADILYIARANGTLAVMSL